MNEMDRMRCYRCGYDGVDKKIEIIMATTTIISGVCEKCLPIVIDEINKKENVTLLLKEDILIRRGYMK